MQLELVIESVLAELENALVQISDEAYTAPSSHLFKSTIGQHVRHIIELFQCLSCAYVTGIVNYDKRKRDLQIETNRIFAIELMHSIVSGLLTENRELVLETGLGIDGHMTTIPTNYLRELNYNLEHTIHHMALIRVGIAELTEVQVPANFGVAPSTIQYRKECVQ